MFGRGYSDLFPEAETLQENLRCPSLANAGRRGGNAETLIVPITGAVSNLLSAVVGRYSSCASLREDQPGTDELADPRGHRGTRR